MFRNAKVKECTSAVSSDVEGRMYEHAKELGITLITISIRCVVALFLHAPDSWLITGCRPSLTKYHTQLLTLSGDGSGRWTLTRVGTAEERVTLDREIQTLESKLAEVGEWEQRVQELNRLLAASE